MKYIYGGLIIAWLGVNQVLKVNIDTMSIVALLGALCLFIIKEKFFDDKKGVIGFLLIALIICYYNNEFLLLLGIPIYDLAYYRYYKSFLGILTGTLLLCVKYEYINECFYIINSGLFGFIIGDKDNNEKKHITLLDDERRLRYRLEQTQNELINSKKEIQHLTEIRERNRIAHEIHDNIGHSLAGVIFQIEAAIRIMNKDKEKLEDILRLSSKKLSEALELTRNTVYNIRADKEIGLRALEGIIRDFKYCSIAFEHTGDFSIISSASMKILEANIMELLTNASKYSGAKEIAIRINIGKRNIRLYYKDDGMGCSNIKEGLGLSGMKNRVNEVGGTIAIDGSNGFLVVCNLPMEDRGFKGEEIS